MFMEGARSYLAKSQSITACLETLAETHLRGAVMLIRSYSRVDLPHWAALFICQH